MKPTSLARKLANASLFAAALVILPARPSFAQG